jgi:CHAT domain-containing protein
VDSRAGTYGDPAIPIAYDESSELAQMFSDADLVSAPSNIQNILLRLPSADLFHFTGHSTSEGSSAQLSLGMPEGQNVVLLTPTSLRNVALPHCQLAFLAACTTLGEEPRRIEEPFALPSAFLKAGVVDVIASRWDVDSQASRILVLAFYRALLEGKSPAFALKSAEDAVRNTPKYQHPYYWASFCLIEQ